jgi:hypothetical protein
LPTGAVVGIAVGVGIAVIIAIGVGILLWRRSRASKAQAAAAGYGAPAPKRSGFLDMFKKSPSASNAQTFAGPTDPSHSAYNHWQGPPPPIQELDGNPAPRVVEVPAVSAPGELDGKAMSEMATPESQYYMFHGNGGKSPS